MTALLINFSHAFTTPTLPRKRWSLPAWRWNTMCEQVGAEYRGL